MAGTNSYAKTNVAAARLGKPTRFTPVLLALGLLVSGHLHAREPSEKATQDAPLRWSQLPDLPAPLGLGGPIVGLHDGALIVAGGANFPDGRPWEGAKKVWHDRIYVLRQGAKAWIELNQRLPRPTGYSVTLTTPRGIAVIGGNNSGGPVRDAFFLRLRKDELEVEPLPTLPVPIANACGALLGNTIYLAGGETAPLTSAAVSLFLALDLSTPTDKREWRVLPTWPGPARMLAVSGVQDGAFYLFGGVELIGTGAGAPQRRYLSDAYRYSPLAGWQPIAHLPAPLAAAPSPAIAVGTSHLIVLSGDDGEHASRVAELKDEHAGFRRSALAYHTVTDQWIDAGETPFSLATTTAVRDGDRVIVASGETRPGVRSSTVWSGEIVAQKAAFGWVNYLTLIAYLVGMVAIGWQCAARNKSTEDYFKASGRIPWWAAGISIYATMLSSVTFMAVPAKAYSTDWTFFWANVPILLLAPLVISFYLPFFRQLTATSAYEYLEQRFNLAARLYASAAFILFQLGRQAIVLLLPSLALATVSDLDVTTCVVLMGVLCVLYTTMGGIEAVIWTDVVQTVVLLGAAILSLVMIVVATEGGIAGFWSTVSAADKLNMFNWKLDPSTAADAFWVILVGSLFANLVPYTSDQTVVQRYMTTPDESTAARAIWTNSLMAIPSTALFFAIGTALFVFYSESPERLDPTQATDAVFPAFIVQNMPVGVAGVVIAGIFAAAQSTVSASLNSVSNSIMTDFYGRFGGCVNGPRSLRLARWLTAGNGLFATGAALVLARLNMESLWDAYLNLVGLAGSGLAGLFALGIFTRRANGAGAMVGAVASACVLYWVQQRTDIHFLLYACIGFLTCLIVGAIVSPMLPASDKSLHGLTIYTRRGLGSSTADAAINSSISPA